MKGCCSFKAIVDGVYVHSPKDRNCSVTILSCNRNIESHKSTCKFTGPEDEVGLIF